MNSMMSRAGWAIAAALGMVVVATLAGVVHGGPLDPPGAPAPTQPQVEPRSPIPPVGWNGTFPIVISQPGSYFLTGNLTVTTGNPSAIQIAASDVSIDLDGFALSGSNTGYDGIAVSGVRTRLTVRNGNLHDWSNAGIDFAASPTDYATQSDIEDLQVSTGNVGIWVNSGTTVRRVSVENEGTGISLDDTGNVYAGGLIEDCTASKNFHGILVNANNVTVRNCAVDSNTSIGVLVEKAFDVVEDTTIQGTATGVLLDVASSKATVTHNIFSNTTNWVTNSGSSNNRVGTSDATLLGTQPWSNAGP